MKIQPPEYADGAFRLYKIKEDNTTDFPIRYLEDQKMTIWYREISVFDRVRYEFDQGGKEVTLKIRTPMYKGIDSQCVCMIEGRQHQVYNATHVTDKNGFKETELTLIVPEKELDIE